MTPVLAAAMQQAHAFHVTPREGEWIAAVLLVAIIAALVRVLS